MRCRVSMPLFDTELQAPAVSAQKLQEFLRYVSSAERFYLSVDLFSEGRLGTRFRSCKGRKRGKAETHFLCKKFGKC